MRTTLSDLREAELEQYLDDLRRLENGYLTQLCDCDAVDANKFGLKLWFTVLEEHGDYLLEVLVQFVERGALRVRPRKSRNEADKQTRARITLDYCGERPHGALRRVEVLIIRLTQAQCKLQLSQQFQPTAICCEALGGAECTCRYEPRCRSTATLESREVLWKLVTLVAIRRS